MKLVVILTYLIFKEILCSEMCEHLEKICINSVNTCFPDDQCMMLQNHACVKGPFKVQGYNQGF